MSHRHVYCPSLVTSACYCNFPCCFSYLSVTNLVTLQKWNLCWSILTKQVRLFYFEGTLLCFENFKCLNAFSVTKERRLCLKESLVYCWHKDRKTFVLDLLYATRLCCGIMRLQNWTFVLFKIFLSLWSGNVSVLCYSKNVCIYTFHVKLSILLGLNF